MHEAAACLNQLQSGSTLAISAVTEMELITGCRNKRELGQLAQFLRRFDRIKLSEAISDEAVRLLELYRLSHGLLIADSLIAATAITLAAPLISKNQRDFQFVTNLNLLPYP